MSETTELIAQQILNGNINKRTWGNIIYNAKVYGAKGDGVSDDTAGIQAAVNAALAEDGGIVLVPAGNYLLSSTIYIPKSVFIIGTGKGSDTSNTNGSGLGITNFRWIGASGGTMFHFKSNTPNNYLFGGGLESCLLDGAGTASMGVRGSSIGFMKFKSLEARSFLSQGIRIDADNGVLSQFNEIEDYHFVYGASAPTENAHGLVLAGNASAGVTQNHILSITALVNNGYAVRIEWSDNNIFEKVHAATLGTGGAINFANGVGGSAAKNLVKYVVGKMYAESLSEGNRIMHAISEGGGLIADPGAQIHYEVEDYVNNRLFMTHQYVMSDQKDLAIGELSIMDGGAATGIAGGQWPCINLVDAVDSRIGAVVPSVYKWNSGTIKYLRIRYMQDTANAGNNYRIFVNASTFADNAAAIALEYTAMTLVPASALQYMNQYVDIPINLSYTNGDSIFFSIIRNGAPAEDTATGNFQVLGVSLIYQATGPDSPGSGTWAVTLPYYP